MELASQCQLTRRDDTLKLANMIGRDLSAATQITGHDIALEPQVRRTASGVRPRRVRGSLVDWSGRARGQETEGHGRGRAEGPFAPTSGDRGHAGRPGAAVPARPPVALVLYRAELAHGGWVAADLRILWARARSSPT